MRCWGSPSETSLTQGARAWRRAAGHLRCTPGSSKAIWAVLLSTGWQRCRVYFLRNVLAQVPKGSSEMVRDRLVVIAGMLFARCGSWAVCRQVFRLRISDGSGLFRLRWAASPAGSGWARWRVFRMLRVVGGPVGRRSL